MRKRFVCIGMTVLLAVTAVYAGAKSTAPKTPSKSKAATTKHTASKPTPPRQQEPVLVIPSTGPIPSNIFISTPAAVEGTIVDQSEKAGRAFLLHSPTFTFDGKPESIRVISQRPINSFNVWEFVYRFESTHAGYGNRQDMILAQVITPHIVRIVVQDGTVVSAVMDDQWDELHQTDVKQSTILPEFSEKDDTIRVQANTAFIIKLVANPTTGYSWEPTIEDSARALIAIEGSRFEMSQNNQMLVGAPGVQVWQCRALNKGQTTLTFRYIRPWEEKAQQKAAQEKTYTLIVE